MKAGLKSIQEIAPVQLHKVWILCGVLLLKKAIGTKWVFRNKERQRSIVVKKAVAQGFCQSCACQTKSISVKPLWTTSTPRSWYEIISSFLLENGFRKALLIKSNGTELKKLCTKDSNKFSLIAYISFWDTSEATNLMESSLVKTSNVADISEFDFCSIKTATTPIESKQPLVKDEHGVEVDVHEYRSMIGSLMYLTASRPNIMFAVCAYASAKKHTNMANSTTEAEMLQLLIAVGQMQQDYIILSDVEINAGLAHWGAAVDQGEGSAQLAEPQHILVDPISSTSQPPIPSPIPSPPHPSPPPHSPHQSPPYLPPHSPHQSPPFLPPHYSPPRSYKAPLPEGNTSRSAEDNMQLKELMDIVPRLVTRIETLETELQQTKTTYGKAVLTLVKRKSTDIATPKKLQGGSKEDISPTILEEPKQYQKEKDAS
ncbi:hypothetical protein Tco_0997697 [Tanacetum coccineum]